MELENRHINFIFLNTPSDYAEGKLQLALPFYCEYRDVLPPKLSLHVESNSCWEAFYVRGSSHIKGLAQMMSFYGLKPCYIVMMQYLGEGHFNVKFYNAYGVEMMYQKENRAVGHNVVSSEVEIDKLHSIFHFNGYNNFLGIFNFTVQKEHLIEKDYTKVLSVHGSYELRLNESVKFITLGFKDHKWKIKLKWSDEEVLFNKKWFDFVRASSIGDGDVLAIYKSDKRFEFQVCVFEKAMLDVQAQFSTTSFFKFMSSDVFDNDELELPLLFSNSHSETIGNVIKIELGDGYSTQFKYCSSQTKIYGLRRFIGKYDIDEDYVLVFKYLGDSTFALTVFDFQCMNHLRGIEGSFRFEDFLYPPIDTEVIDISDDENNGHEDNGTELIMVAGETESVAEDLHNDGLVPNSQLVFTVELQNSHVDQQCHGAYIPCSSWTFFASWGRRTSVMLSVGPSNWSAEVLKRKRVCRFGKGWDKFMKDNNLVAGQIIAFQYTGQFRFEVVI